MTGSSERRERGAATLVTVAVLLFCLAVVALHATRSSVTAQRLAANDLRARQALAAAEAGLAAGLAALASRDLLAAAPFDGVGALLIEGPAGTLANGARYRTLISNAGLDPHRAERLRIAAEGRSADGAAARLVERMARVRPTLPNPPPAPLVARGAIALHGGLAVTNAATGIGLWSGGAAVIDGAPVLDIPGPRCPPAGLCAGDARLAALNPDEFFANFFGTTRAQLRSTARTVGCGVCAADLDGARDALLWVDAAGAAVTLAGASIGAADKPVVLVIDGDLRFDGAARIYGLVYVTGDWLGGTGGAVIEGAIVVAGDADTAGARALGYDAALMETLGERGAFAWIAGSWADF